MAERRELLEIYKLLSSESSAADLEDHVNQLSDVEILKFIVNTVKSRQISQHEGDSLAFPTDSRASNDLTTANRLWSKLDQFNDNLRQDYTCRRQMLLRRLDCTIESFKWKGTSASKPDKVRHEPRHGAGKSMNDQIHEIYDKARVTIKEEPQISISNLLATREKDCDRLLNGVVSTKSVDCEINYGNNKQLQQPVDNGRVNLKQVIIPHVPDRGGRTDEIRPPVKESFSHQKGGFRHGRGRHR